MAFQPIKKIRKKGNDIDSHAKIILLKPGNCDFAEMKILKIIKDTDSPKDESTWEIRETSRGVFITEDHLVPLLFASNCGIHELPGGGIEAGEDKLTGLKREVLEEAGGEIKIIQDLGQIVEYRSQINRKQISYCYFGSIKQVAVPQYTEEEILDGTVLEWLPIDEAISKIRSDKSTDYDGSFIQQRDLFMLELVKQMLIAN